MWEAFLQWEALTIILVLLTSMLAIAILATDPTHHPKNYKRQTNTKPSAFWLCISYQSGSHYPAVIAVPKDLHGCYLEIPLIYNYTNFAPVGGARHPAS